MKPRAIGIVIMILGALLILTPWYIFPVCGVGRYAPPAGALIGYHGCHATLRAETLLGAVTIILGVLPLLWPQRKALMAATWASVGVAVLAVLFPTVITGLCKVATMPCRLGTLPALETVATLLVINAIFGLLIYRKMP